MAWSKNNIEVKIHRIRPKPDDNERFFEWTVLAQVVIENSEILRWRVENIIENIDKQDSTYLPDDCYVITDWREYFELSWDSSTNRAEIFRSSEEIRQCLEEILLLNN